MYHHNRDTSLNQRLCKGWPPMLTWMPDYYLMRLRRLEMLMESVPIQCYVTKFPTNLALRLAGVTRGRILPSSRIVGSTSRAKSSVNISPIPLNIASIIGELRLKGMMMMTLKI